MTLVDDVRTVPADERGAYLLSGVFRTLAWICSGLSVGLGFWMAVGNADIDAVERTLVFGAVVGAGLFVAGVLLFLGYVLALLAGIHAQLRTTDADRP
jgi:hypothetical protein